MAQSAIVLPGIVRSIEHLSLRRNMARATPSMSLREPAVKAELLRRNMARRATVSSAAHLSRASEAPEASWPPSS
jgi:hypothetical protein